MLYIAYFYSFLMILFLFTSLYLASVRHEIPSLNEYVSKTYSAEDVDTSKDAMLPSIVNSKSPPFAMQRTDEEAAHDIALRNTVTGSSVTDAHPDSSTPSRLNGWKDYLAAPVDHPFMTSIDEYARTINRDKTGYVYDINFLNLQSNLQTDARKFTESVWSDIRWSTQYVGMITTINDNPELNVFLRDNDRKTFTVDGKWSLLAFMRKMNINHPNYLCERICWPQYGEVNKVMQDEEQSISLEDGEVTVSQKKQSSPGTATLNSDGVFPMKADCATSDIFSYVLFSSSHQPLQHAKHAFDSYCTNFCKLARSDVSNTDYFYRSIEPFISCAPKSCESLCSSGVSRKSLFTQPTQLTSGLVPGSSKKIKDAVCVPKSGTDDTVFCSYCDIKKSCSDFKTRPVSFTNDPDAGKRIEKDRSLSPKLNRISDYKQHCSWRTVCDQYCENRRGIEQWQHGPERFRIHVNSRECVSVYSLEKKFPGQVTISQGAIGGTSAVDVEEMSSASLVSGDNPLDYIKCSDIRIISVTNALFPSENSIDIENTSNEKNEKNFMTYEGAKENLVSGTTYLNKVDKSFVLSVKRDTDDDHYNLELLVRGYNLKSPECWRALFINYSVKEQEEVRIYEEKDESTTRDIARDYLCEYHLYFSTKASTVSSSFTAYSISKVDEQEKGEKTDDLSLQTFSIKGEVPIRGKDKDRYYIMFCFGRSDMYMTGDHTQTSVVEAILDVRFIDESLNSETDEEKSHISEPTVTTAKSTMPQTEGVKQTRDQSTQVNTPKESTEKQATYKNNRLNEPPKKTSDQRIKNKPSVGKTGKEPSYKTSEKRDGNQMSKSSSSKATSKGTYPRRANQSKL